MARILIADDNVVLTEIWRDSLEGEGHEITLARSGSEALSLLDRYEFDLVLTDMNMPSGGGISVTTAKKDLNAGIPIVVISGDPVILASGLLPKMLRLGATEVAFKPLKPEELIDIVGRCLDRRFDMPVSQRFRKLFEAVGSWKAQSHAGNGCS